MFNVGDEVSFVDRTDMQGTTAIVEKIYAGFNGATFHDVRHKTVTSNWPRLLNAVSHGWSTKQLQMVYNQPDEIESFFV